VTHTTFQELLLTPYTVHKIHWIWNIEFRKTILPRRNLWNFVLCKGLDPCPFPPLFIKGGPEPSEILIRKVLVPKGRFHFNFIPVSKNKSDRLMLPGTFRELDEVCSEVPEDSRVLRVRRLWFPTSNRLQTWLVPSGTTWSRQYHVSTIVWHNLPPYDRFCYFVFSFSSKRAWQSGSKHYQRWYKGRLCQTMVDSWYCLDRIVPERMTQVSRRSEVGNHKRRTVLWWALLSNGYFVYFLILCL